MGPIAGTQPGRGGRAGVWLLTVLVLGAVVGLDQLSKHAIERSIVAGEEHRLFPGIQLVNTRNHGVAFGFLPGSHAGVTILIALAMLVLLAYFATHTAQPLIWLPTGMLLGGALGNVIDRLREGAVTDFIKLPLGWPPFNLADSSITLGIVVLFLIIENARHTDPDSSRPGSGSRRPGADSRPPASDSGHAGADSGRAGPGSGSRGARTDAGEAGPDPGPESP
jgi:signal peptidase II